MDKKKRIFLMPESHSLPFIFEYLFLKVKDENIDLLLLLNKKIDMKKFKHLMYSLAKKLKLKIKIYNFEEWTNILYSEEEEIKTTLNFNLNCSIAWMFSILNIAAFNRIIGNKKIQ